MKSRYLLACTCALLASLAFAQKTWQAPDSELQAKLQTLPPGTTEPNQKANVALIHEMIREANPNDKWLARAYYLLAQQHTSLGNDSDAIQAYEQCVKLPESHSELHLSAWNNLGALYRKLGDAAKADEAAVKVAAAAKAPSASARDKVHAGRNLLLKAQSLVGATQDKKTFLAAAEVTRDAIEMLESAGKEEDAERYLFTAREMLGEYLHRAGKEQASGKAFDELLKGMGDHERSIDIAYYRAQEKFGYGKIPVDPQIDILKRYPAKSRYRVLPLYDLATAKFEARQPDAAAEAWKEILEYANPATGELSSIDQTIAMAGLRLASHLLGTGDKAGARQAAAVVTKNYAGSEFATEAERVIAKLEGNDPNTTADPSDTRDLWPLALVGATTVAGLGLAVRKGVGRKRS